MKLSKLFHTLYATVIALPVIIIPIFAININQKSVEPISIEVQEKVSVDFNQMYESRSEQPITEQHNLVNDRYYATIGYARNLKLNDTYIVRAYINYNNSDLNYALHFSGWGNDSATIYVSNNFNNGFITQKFVCSNLQTAYMFDTISIETANYDTSFTINFFNLTQMGLENISVNDFNSLFISSNYPYIESQKMLVDKPTPTTYDDTDIGSQFLYSLYKPVQDYFNFGEFFGLSGMYDWFQLNFFNGTAPLSFFIVFNVMIYWLFISLFWLLFDILIYVPMVIHKWLDKAEM